MDTQQKNPIEILRNVGTELTEVNNKIQNTIQTDVIPDAEIQEWINYLNQLIRKLDHIVETLEETQR